MARSRQGHRRASNTEWEGSSERSTREHTSRPSTTSTPPPGGARVSGRASALLGVPGTTRYFTRLLLPRQTPHLLLLLEGGGCVVPHSPPPLRVTPLRLDLPLCRALRLRRGVRLGCGWRRRRQGFLDARARACGERVGTVGDAGSHGAGQDVCYERRRKKCTTPCVDTLLQPCCVG